MKNLQNFNVEIDGCTGEIFVSANHEGRFICVFAETDKTDFCSIYNAFGCMVLTFAATAKETEFIPIKLQDKTKLTHAIIREMWRQISSQIALP
jgi:hypothetical protein